MIDKQQLVLQIIGKLHEEAASLARGALMAHAYATDSEAKAENKYDTRGLEASYLAGAQARLASETQQMIAVYNSLELKNFSANDPIALTALVEVERNGTQVFYFIGPKGGGITLELQNTPIMLITPTSPVGKQLIGRMEGDCFQMKAEQGMVEYEIVSLS